jgi:hypothetical protein
VVAALPGGSLEQGRPARPLPAAAVDFAAALARLNYLAARAPHILAHRHLTTTQKYLTPSQDKVIQSGLAHHARREHERVKHLICALVRDASHACAAGDSNSCDQNGLRPTTDDGLSGLSHKGRLGRCAARPL